ncbi:MAG: anaerobic ribonucleoside-triphosphate reductase activating protein [Clostridia bacterium]|nr:anaerobic ribonucleoside-triphosphate reductase activating protein [Clostridia bacterium]
MELFGLEKLSLVDYDGKVACTVFTGTCNFCCGFCHNAPLVKDFKNLPVISEEEVFEYLNKRKGIIEGVCVSGGEPTLQKDLPMFLERLKNLGLSVKLDTNGTNPTLIKELFTNGLVDYFAMDIKNNKEDYAEIIGVKGFNTKKVENSVEFFLTNKVDFELRTTLIKEYHKEENIEKIGAWIKGTKKYFLQKFKLSENCISQNLNGVEEEKAKEFIEILKNYNINAKLRGY